MTTHKPILNHSQRLPSGSGEAQRRQPVRPRDAASLILIRGAGSASEVLMGQRAARHAFLPGAYVFPGGRVDPDDARMRPATHLDTRTSVYLARAGGQRRARAIAMTAIRETFEETGLLLGAPGDPGPSRDESWRAIKAMGQAPDLARLSYLGRAITPAESPIRFDARFVVADGSQAEGTLGGSGELLDLQWIPIGDALDLTIADVTEFMLGELARTLARSGGRGRPLFRYRRGRAYAVYS
ncbi:MAG: NUDIX hydrolase [Alphaproteobacteria bacterium]